MINCNDCKGTISENAVRCPHCGAKGPKRTWWDNTQAGCFVMMLIILLCAIMAWVQ